MKENKCCEADRQEKWQRKGPDGLQLERAVCCWCCCRFSPGKWNRHGGNTAPPENALEAPWFPFSTNIRFGIHAISSAPFRSTGNPYSYSFVLKITWQADWAGYGTSVGKQRTPCCIGPYGYAGRAAPNLPQCFFLHFVSILLVDFISGLCANPQGAFSIFAQFRSRIIEAF